MKILFFLIAISCVISANANDRADCFIAVKNGELLVKEGERCSQRYGAGSTFKIAISLMGYDSGILIDEHYPEFHFKEGYDDFLPR